MKLNKLSLKDKSLFEEYLHLSPHELSAYTFTNIYIWKRLFDIKWSIIGNSLCIFFKDKIGTFLYLAPLAKRIKPQTLKEVFNIMDATNKNKDISRIENIKEKDVQFFKSLGYKCTQKYPEYLCKRADLTALRGDRFKSKRASFNYFIKNYKYKYLPLSLRYKNECLELYDKWSGERKRQNSDRVYQGMLGDSRTCLKVLVDNYAHLDVVGRIVKIEGKIKAFTFGFRLNRDTFVVLYEITDLSIKGLAQFIFREFCRELKNYKYINIMDDSGLENLRKVKLSYHPLKLIPSFIATR